MSALVILADESENEATASLAAMGHAVRAARDVTRAQIAAARKVIVVWSRTARGTPALKAAARRAKAHGKLVCVRLDAALPPVELGGAKALRMPNGRAQTPAWRRLLRVTRQRQATEMTKPARALLTTRRAVRRREIATAAATPAPRAASRFNGARVLAGLSAIALIVLAAGSEIYARDAEFAARIDALAQTAQAQAATLVDDIAR